MSVRGHLIAEASVRDPAAYETYARRALRPGGDRPIRRALPGARRRQRSPRGRLGQAAAALARTRGEAGTLEADAAAYLAEQRALGTEADVLRRRI